MANNSQYESMEDLDKRKKLAEIEKITTETKELKKCFLRKFQFWGIVTPIFAALFAYCFAGGKEFIDAKREHLAVEKDLLLFDSKKLEERVNNFRIDSIKLSHSNDSLKQANSFLRKQNKQFAADTIKKKFETIFAEMDSNGTNFNPYTNLITYNHLKRILSETNNEEINVIINDYINDTRTSLNTKLCCLIATYKVTGNRKWYEMFNSNLKSNIDFFLKSNTETYKSLCKCIDNNDLNINNFHETINLIVAQSLNQNLDNNQFLNIVNFISKSRKDSLLSYNYDSIGLINLLNLYSNNIDKNIQNRQTLSKIMMALQFSRLPKNIIYAYWSQMVIKHLSPSNNRTGTFGVPLDYSFDILLKFGIKEGDFYSDKFWNQFQKNNPSLVSHLFEADLKTYRKNPKALAHDIEAPVKL